LRQARPAASYPVVPPTKFREEPRFIDELEHLPPEFAVVGINDYMFLDGYKKLRDEVKTNHRLKNLQAIFPVVEFRIKKFAGVQFRDTTRINLHVIFDPELEPSLIESQFLNSIQGGYALAPTCQTPTWQGVVTMESLASLGAQIKKNVPAIELPRFGSDLEEGFNNLNVDEDVIFKQLENNTFLRDHYIVAIGKSEWDKIKWDDTSIAEKKDIINRAKIVFTASASVDAFRNAKNKLLAQSVNSLLLDCSDAHSFRDSRDKDRLGNCFTWIKADPTFKGLLQATREPDERCFIGDMPKKLGLVAMNKTKFITSIQIDRKPHATIGETWFDKIDLPINPDLVAIIGNKGKGKSALTDAVGLLGNTKQHKEFTFLSPSNFRQAKDNKAKYFEATLIWASGQKTKKGLEEDVDERQPELVKYIPQNFLEKICTQIGRIEETEFDHELKKVIFSHVSEADRLNKESLDELLKYKTAVATEKIGLLKQELHQINEAIVVLEEQVLPEHRERVQNLLTLKEAELATVERSKPPEVPKPENDPTKQKEIASVSHAIEEKKLMIGEIEKKITVANEAIAKQTQLIAAADRLIERLSNLDRQIQSFLRDCAADVKALGLSVDLILKVETKKDLIDPKKDAAIQEKKMQQAQIEQGMPGSLTTRKATIEREIVQLQSTLDEPNKKFQAYLAALKIWERQKTTVIGAENELETIAFYKKRLNDLAQVPIMLRQRRLERLTKAKEIHSEIKKLSDVFRELYAAVNGFIEGTPLAREKLHLNFEVSVVDTGFEESFFDILNRGFTGTFCGIEEGHKRLDGMLRTFDFNSEAAVESFLVEIIRALECDLRTPDARPVRVVEQIRKGRSVLTLYDLIFSLDFLRPRYALKMGEKDLNELSPGERGALLLVFYLLVDNDDVPLLIDQPEENLDNQTVYELLVPCVKEAKQRRQIFIVTHNPNLAVVCDAEQIICADLDKKNNYQMRYIPGSVENPVMNKAIVDILEGTMPAFDNRDSKYYDE